MKLPKQLDKDGIDADVRAALDKEQFEICSDPHISIPSFELNSELRKYIFYAKALGELVIGYETIEKSLASEKKGLMKVDNQSERVSRLLIVTNDGSERFYRELKYLQHKQGGRVLICRLNVDAILMGGILGLKERSIKAVLINRKTSVVNVLKAVLFVEKILKLQTPNV